MPSSVRRLIGDWTSRRWGRARPVGSDRRLSLWLKSVPSPSDCNRTRSAYRKSIAISLSRYKFGIESDIPAATMARDEIDIDEDDGELTEATAPAEVPEPRANPYLAGHAAAEAALLEAHGQGRLPHALILSGPRRIGKATLAFRLARFLLAQGRGGPDLFGAAPPSSLAVADDDPVFSRVASGGHA